MPAEPFGACLQRAPLVLALLVVLGIVMPLCVAARYLMTSTRYAGPNSVMAETMEIFFRCLPAVTRLAVSRLAVHMPIAMSELVPGAARPGR